MKELMQLGGTCIFFIASLIAFFAATEFSKEIYEQRAKLAKPHLMCQHNKGYKSPKFKKVNNLVIAGIECNDGYVDGVIAWKLSKH